MNNCGPQTIVSGHLPETERSQETERNELGECSTQVYTHMSTAGPR